MIHLFLIDILIILLYFGVVLYVGFRSVRKTTKSEDDYLLAGRSLTLPIFVMTLVSTWYGGILGVGEYSYRYGISNWVTQGVPYYIFAAVFAMFLAKKVRQTNLFTIPDKLEDAYDKKTALLGSLLTFILVTPAPYVLMLSVLLQMLFGWNSILSVIVVAVVAVSYLYNGGMNADIQTDIVEFFLMFLGFLVILPFCFFQYGGFDFLQSNLPQFHLTWHGGNSLQYIFVWFFIALWTLVDPAFHQRCYAAKDGTTAQKGILWSILFWLVFDGMTATAGLYARAALPNLSDPLMAYPMLAEKVLPPFAKGLFYVGLLATMMSTLNTLAFISAQTLGRDIALRFQVSGFRFEVENSNPSTSRIFDKPQNSNLSMAFTKVGLIISFVFSAILALMIPSVIQLWYTIGTVAIPGLLIPLMASYFERFKISSRYAFMAMLFGWLISLGWLIAGHFNGTTANYPLGIEPMYPGLIVSILIWALGRLRT
jgi:SSS family solute:Na+ symporter